MYIWKIDKLKNDLRKKSLSESESFKYLFVNIIIYTIGLIPSSNSNVWDVYNALVTIVITASGIYYAYKCNKGAHGDNFLQKYLSIGWVTSIRWTVFFMLPAMAIYVFAIGISISVTYVTTPLDVIFLNLMYISYFWLLGKHIKDLAK